MAAYPVNSELPTRAAAYQNDPEPVAALSSMPQEVLTRIQESLNPKDAGALSCTSRRLHATNDPVGVLILRFEEKESVTLQDIRQMEAMNPGFVSYKKLKLDLSNSDITDLELKNVIARFPNIIEINANDCLSLTDNGLQHLAPLENLTTLNLGYLPLISDYGLKQLAPLANLATLDLTGTGRHWVDDSGLQHLARVLPKLDIRRAYFY